MEVVPAHTLRYNSGAFGINTRLPFTGSEPEQWLNGGAGIRQCKGRYVISPLARSLRRKYSAAKVVQHEKASCCFDFGAFSGKVQAVLTRQADWNIREVH